MNIQILERTDCKGRQTVVTLRFMCIGRTERKVKNNCKDRPNTTAIDTIASSLRPLRATLRKAPQYLFYFYLFIFYLSSLQSPSHRAARQCFLFLLRPVRYAQFTIYFRKSMTVERSSIDAIGNERRFFTIYFSKSTI